MDNNFIMKKLINQIHFYDKNGEETIAGVIAAGFSAFGIFISISFLLFLLK